MIDEKTFLEQQKIDGLNIASTISLLIFGMLFAALLLCLILMRDNFVVWPPPAFLLLSISKPTLSTIFIFLSSLFLWSAQRNLSTPEKLKKARISLKLSIFLGFCFLAVQFLFWRELNTHGFNVESGAFASFLQAMTWIHAAHILLGLFFLLIFLNRIRKSRTDFFLNENEYKIQTIKINFYSSFWHFLSLVWVLLLIGLFAPL
ncbi:MAG: cytochrome c oxidase subunit 3 [Bacteriovoracaceae bacterium]|nr:cytochrome c oxidase subunit 3 [Bacteriovoracaceae bacterium]